MFYKIICCLWISSQLIALSISSIQTLENSECGMGPWFAANDKGDALLCWIELKKDHTLVASTKSKQNQWLPPQTIGEIGRLYDGKLYCTINTEGIPYIVWQASKPQWDPKYGEIFWRCNWLEGATRKAESWSKPVVFTHKEPVILQAIGLNKEEHLTVFFEKLEKASQCINLTSWSPDLTLRNSFSEWFPETHATAMATFSGLDPFFAFVAPDKENEDRAMIYEIVWRDGVPIHEKIGEFQSEAFYHFQATLDDQGRKGLIWGSGKHDELVCVMTKEEGKWSSPYVFRNEEEVLGCSIAFDNKGNMMAVWSQENAVKFAYKPSGGSWLLPALISSSVQYRSSPQIAFDRDQHFVIVWNEGEGRSQIYGTTFSTDTQKAEKPVLLTSYNEWAVAPHIAFSEKGKGMIVWATIEGEIPNVRATICTADLSVK